MNLDEYSQFDGLGLADLVRRKQVRPSELARLALQAIDALNPEINAVIGRLPVDLDELDEAELPEGPFTGVPFLIKDLVLNAAGVPCDMGSRLIEGAYIPPADTDLMARYRQAGLVTLGRTNTPEFGVNISTEPLLHGPTRNPWDITKSAGGSSGGAAAAVAARILPIAHGSDGGGSIRIPASCCGLVGLKPTRGRIPVGPGMEEGDDHGFGIEHAVSRTVRDSAALLDASVGDSYVIPLPERQYLDEVGTVPESLKIAFTTAAWFDTEVDPACIQAVEESAALCESLGHTMVEAAPAVDSEAYNLANLGIWSSVTASGIEYFSEVLGRTPNQENLEATTWALYQHGLQMSAMDLENAIAMRNRVTRAVGGFFREYDVLLTPTLPRPPADLGTYNANDPDLDAAGWLRHISSFASFTPLFNMTGQPAISLPLHHGEAGLPIGSQFVARFGDEATLFRLAGQLEQAQPWIDRRPAISL